MQDSRFSIRPRSLGEFLDFWFRLYRHRFGQFAVFGVITSTLSALAAMVWQATIFSGLNFELDPEATPPIDALLGMLALMPVLMLWNLAVYSFSGLAIASIVDDAVHGRHAGNRTVAGRAGRRLLSGLGAALLTWVVSFVVLFAIAMGFVVLLMIPVLGWILLVPFLPLAVLAFAYVMAGLSLAVPLVYLERLGPIDAVSRSWELVMRRGGRRLHIESNWVRIAIVGLISLIVTYALILFANLPLMIAQGFAAAFGEGPAATALGPQLLPLSVTIPMTLAGAIIQGLFIPISIIPWPLMVFDIRARHEGADLERSIANLAGLPATEPPSEPA